MPLFSHMSESREAYTRFQVVHSADNRCKPACPREFEAAVIYPPDCGDENLAYIVR